MKRNKEKSRAMRSGQSSYKRSAKKPCQHCQDITAASRKRAHGGKSEGESYV